MNENINTSSLDVLDKTMQIIVSDVDQNGDSYMRYENISVLQWSDFTSGKLEAQSAMEIEDFTFCCSGKGWTSDYHNEPYCLLAILNRGEIIFETSDGNSKAVSKGSIILGMDLHGKGHKTKTRNGNPIQFTLLRLKTP